MRTSQPPDPSHNTPRNLQFIYYLRASRAHKNRYLHWRLTAYRRRLPISPRRLFLVTVTFSPKALTVILHRLALILPPLAILIVALAAYAPHTLLALTRTAALPLLTTAAAFYLACFLRRGQPWAPRIFSPIPWTALRLAALAILAGHLTANIPFTFIAFPLSIFTLSVALTLTQYTTFILAADIIAPHLLYTV